LSFYSTKGISAPISNDKENSTLQATGQLSIILIVGDILLLPTSYFAANFIKRGNLELLPQYDKLLLLLCGLWFVSSIITKKFFVKEYKSFYYSLWQWIKAGVLILAFISVIVFGFRLFYFSRFQVLGSILILIVLEVIFLRLYFWLKIFSNDEQDIESIDRVKTILTQEKIPLDIDIEFIRKKLFEPARVSLGTSLAEKNPKLLDFIDEHINIDEILCVETFQENSNDFFKQQNSNEVFVRLFLNDKKVNDIRRLNQYFLSVHQMLLPGGYYISWVHTIKTHHQRIYSMFPRQIANIIYFFDFCYKRIMPKIPGLKKIYFALSKGKGRIVSKAEILGRLCFCGFEITAAKEIDQKLCFIARKVKLPSLDQSPTYGPLIELKRSGYQNEPVRIYKFRTMHPYSEYLQQYIYDTQGLQKGGKIEDDFRLTTWGRFMRKLWLDELPMLYNWIKGDLQFVGVRPLSYHYLGLYDSELYELRKKVKPGLIPPFYADLPDSFEEICNSERRYIKAFMQNPLKTQWTYFWKAMHNIVITGARSQ
jgi:hypothetical protein